MNRSTLKNEMNEAMAEAKELVKARQEKIHNGRQNGGFNRETLKEVIAIQKQWVLIAKGYAGAHKKYIRTFSTGDRKEIFTHRERKELKNWCREMVIAMELEEAVIQIKQLEIQLKGRLT
ncbi:MAG TPA: hypothetical protein VMY77_11400 [Chitinophagaceae bacterium]|nr:hypothetical protein [Chitinophagaceae bacterium]